MAYEKTNWVNNDEPPISAANLQNVEDGIEHNDIRLNNLDNIMSLTPNSWVANQEYAIHDIVVYNGMLYENITGNNSDTTPDEDVNNWSETKLLVKNSNGLIKINTILMDNTKYSTTETRVGTWIDGKPLYRNYVDLGTLPNATRKNVSTGFPSDISIKKMEAYCYSETIGSTQTLPVVDNVNATGQVRIVYYPNQVSIFTSIDYTNWKGYAFVYYTKTTD